MQRESLETSFQIFEMLISIHILIQMKQRLFSLYSYYNYNVCNLFIAIKYYTNAVSVCVLIKIALFKHSLLFFLLINIIIDFN